ncbi:hypothetical protein [Variovorax saccharolyticus]|uniref:hypothetical protein n=1 Tax=Variovorax saccharolyticus TaxID=3053516 RepID=UPI002575C390|nr:hypothetical protein [Variovorax sp. J31P216]MDM0024119.1 hypothetical protein [Variovorax sp. J31P216]
MNEQQASGRKTIRKRFETWAVFNGWKIKNDRPGPKYPDDTQCAWRGFQAASEESEIELAALLEAAQLALKQMCKAGCPGVDELDAAIARALPQAGASDAK